MATISTQTFLDDGTARTAGEAWTINSGGKLTIRTDTRHHLNAPASLAGSLGSITINDGECLIDATAVRWLPISGGSGSASIGTIISQGGVSGYFLGYWASLTAAPSTTIGATGYIKLREVTGGNFAAGALSGIAASAAGPDVVGWLEVVHDQAANITVPRLGKYTTRGDWFYLDNTSGVAGQIIQTPTNGGGAASFVPAIWVETAPGSGLFEMYPGLNGPTNGWALEHIGTPAAEQDHRQKFVKSPGSGQVQIGETATQTGTYANTAAQMSTYDSLGHSGTYTWADNKVTVYCSGGHFLNDGEQTGLEFTSGSATSGVFTVSVLDAYNFTAAVAGSGAGGNVTSRAYIAVTFASHINQIGFQLNCDFLSGTGVDGTYTVTAVPSTSVYWLRHPHTAALTGGNVAVYKGATITTSAAHNLAIGNRVALDFTSGSGVDGIYTIETVPSSTTFTVNTPYNLTAGNVTINWQIGYVPAAGCKVRIPNIIGRQCATGTWAINAAPHATITSRPEFTTSSAGYIDIEYLTCDWYYNLTQPFFVSLKHGAVFDSVVISGCSTPLVISDFVVGMHSALDMVSLSLSSNFAGLSLYNVKAHRGNTPGFGDHAISILNANNVMIDGVECGIVRFARSTGKPININYCNDVVVSNLTTYNGNLAIQASKRINVNGVDICDRFTGYTNATSGVYLVDLFQCDDVVVANLTYGRNGTIINNHPYIGLLNLVNSSNVKFRNCGTAVAPLLNGTWAINAYGMQRLTNGGGNNNTLKIQQIYADCVVADHCTMVNSDKNVVIENVHVANPYQKNTQAVLSRAISNLNCTIKNLSGHQSTTGASSVYGTHWTNWFNPGGYGELAICCNEPTVESISQVTVVSGSARWNSSGGVILPNVGDQVIWETPDWIRGTTFRDFAASMTGGTIGNYTMTYAVDTGSGYSAFKSLTSANLAAEVIPATGFKLKVSILTAIANTTPITFLRLYTVNDPVSNAANPYPLDTNTLTFTGLPPGCDAVVLTAGTTTLLDQKDALAGATYSYTFSGAQTVDVGFIKPGYVPFYIRNLALTTTDSTIPVSLTQDRNYQ